ncbi:HET-domain-containing protein, partial [Acephala macrosclerotiorum]
TASAESLGLANRWIKECQSSHNCHRRKTTRTFCPTRLIDVGNTAVNTVRLCMGKDLPPGTSYFTLSHCWGKTPMPERLLENNLQSRFALVNYDKLPRNFQDSIRIVRGLGGRYIWIDSLCIIQDSTEDWQHESALMGEVYLNGYCNLSAVASLDSSIGMIFNRQPLNILPLRTRLKVELEHQEQDLYLCDPKLWYQEIAKSPLLSRAWVCQERLLSTCNLHFGQTQMFWECPQHTACETFPNGIPPQIEGYAVDPKVKLKGAQLLRPTFNSASRTLDDPSHPLILWDLVVGLYSTCQLSFGSDKLVAIGGMAAISHQNFSGNYLAGLWQEYLPYQLLWEVLKLAEDSQPPLYRAPTWSWAAVDHELMMHETNSYCVALIDVLDAHIDLAGSNRYGQVKGGYIQM